MGALSEKVIVITGAGTGLGREAALEAVKQGGKVSICCRSIGSIEQMEKDLSPYQGQFLVTQADVSIEEDVNRFIEATISQFGTIDVLINNAAVFENYDIVDSTLESWTHHFENNVTSAFLMTRACIPIMRQQRSGQIISITSGLARQGAAGFSAYSASKAALEALTFTAEEEEAKNGISATVFNPGVMKTKLQSRGDDPSEVAPYLLQLLISSDLPKNRVITVDEVKLRANAKVTL
ncbi:SDR family NAD(P)-dependent oxidoreductase [Alkalihalobacterium bogoriense]|uniref:SDR family NAD(P)-dependent oxidoreductase n=1 Tax=Alkalihalobacterium bogoriense TaxID=246272 RepID=UPI00047BDCD2|nr:SDR family oxidoreductase [Alkalihalobacterium bogoriense]